MTRTITITSGKGGVGKTNLSANLAVQLALQGRRACVFDADLGLANINILFGLYPEKTIEDVIRDKVPLEHILIKNHYGIDIIPGSSGVESIANCDPHEVERLITSLSTLPAYDFLFFDTSAGISRTVVSFCLAASETVLVITPEPTSLTDAYALLKILCANGLKTPVRVVINHCKDAQVARQTYARFRDVVKKYLPVELRPLGFMVEDPKVSFAVKQQQPFINLYPDSLAAKCIKAIATNLVQQSQDAFATAPALESFWKQFINLFSGSLAFITDQGGKKKSQPQRSEQYPVQETAPAQVCPPAEKPNAPVPQPATEPSKPQPAPAQAVSPISEPDHILYTVLSTLASSVATIAEEFKLLRKIFENTSAQPVAARAYATADMQKPLKPKSEPIVLDFETYLQQHGEKCP